MITSGGNSENRNAWLWCNQTLNNVGSGFVYARYLNVSSNSGFPVHKINSNSVNIRVCPSTDADAFGTLEAFTQVFVLDTTRTGWWRVASPIGIGWVASNYID